MKNHINKYIADIIGFNKSIIGRELKMNSDKFSGKYSYDLADIKAKKRQRTKKRKDIVYSLYPNENSINVKPFVIILPFCGICYYII